MNFCATDTICIETMIEDQSKTNPPSTTLGTLDRSQWGQVSCFFKYLSNKHPNHKVYFSCINYCPTVLDFYLCYLYDILNTILEIHISSVYFLHLYWKNFYHMVYLLYSRTPYLRELPLIAMLAILLMLLACYVIYRKCEKQEGK